MDDCLFCKIARGEIPVQKLAENEQALAFPDLRPQAPLHALVIPKTHLASLNDVRDWVVIGRLHELAVEVAKAKGMAASGFRTVFNTGPDAGQSVFHVHLHVLGGRALAWPPG